MTMDIVTSVDGTPIAYVQAGSGRPIVFVGGAFNDHSRTAPLAGALAGEFTVVGYDRRARGASGDTRPYAVDREVEDLAAVLDVVGGEAAVFGYSSGGILALYAATKLPITHLFLFEAPFAAGAPRHRADLPARLDALVAAGRPGDAVALFQTEGIGLPAEMVTQIRQSPMWPALEGMAQSAVYDATLTHELSVPTEAMTAVSAPTLVITGAGTWPVLIEAAKSLPVGRHVEVAGGADHDIPVPETAALVRELMTVNNP
jgi:pimeloyl-ACP methyl ester carboxylesterase